MSQWFHASSKKGLQDLELKQETSEYICTTILCEIYPVYNLVDNFLQYGGGVCRL